MSLDTDVLILGGGCAGLSLAVALAQQAPALRVSVLESREEYRRDRTWCYWNTTMHPFSALATHRWHRWRVRNARAEAVQASQRVTYNHLPADRFYSFATDALRRAGQQLSLGCEVSAVVAEPEGHTAVETNLGRLRATWVFDSRPQRPVTQQPKLLQRFTGWHVETEHACFDSRTVDLMDFQGSCDRNRLPFLYMLPFSPTEALVEATFLDAPELGMPDAEAMLQETLRQANAGSYRIVYREEGSLPMGGMQHPSRSGAAYDIGIRGGRIKASSGYAFQRIQRQSTAIANALSRGLPPPRRVEPAYYDLLDRLFLQALCRFPERASEYFLTLFQRVPPEPLVRFLSETANPVDIARVMLALPARDFLQSAAPFRHESFA